MNLVTYRDSVRGALEAFVEKTPFKSLIRSDALIEIAANVAFHAEEGVAMHPEVFLCQCIDSFRKLSPDGAVYLVGEDDDILRAIKRALKKCSPLTSRDWDILIELTPNKCRYGIFRSSSVVTSLTLGSTYFSTGDQSTTPSIQVTRVRSSIVELRSSCGQDLKICFSHDEVDQSNLNSLQQGLTESILEKVHEDQTKEGARSFLSKLLKHAFQNSHGTLICVIDKDLVDSDSVPELLKDCVRLEPSINLVSEVEKLRQSEGNIESSCSPISYYDLIRGILAFDGITVFSNDGRLVYYNSFVALQEPASGSENHGARKRAFTALTSHLGNPILAAFYLSQDGNSAFIKHE